MPSMKERLIFSVDVVNCAETMIVCLKIAIEESAYNGTTMNVHVNVWNNNECHYYIIFVMKQVFFNQKSIMYPTVGSIVM